MEPHPTSSSTVRRVVAIVLISIGCLLAPVAVVGAWARTQVTDTDGYVEAVAPLAADAGVRNGEFVGSDLFQTLWSRANRIAHDQLVAALRGADGAVRVDDDTVSIEIGPFVAAVRDNLVSSGFSAAQRIPDVQQNFVLFSAEEVQRIQGGYRLLDRYGAVLPFAAAGVIVLGLYVATARRRTLAGAGFGIALSMVLLAVVLAIGRSVYLDHLPATLNAATAGAVFDVLVRSLRTTLRIVFAIGLAIGAAAFIAGRVSVTDV
ncbi:hypothetical protein [Kribbella speibonae]|uniref:Integral membrane protein n=1 Tax=Kribbella speibonae TaxID=1572660 RepID=A0ABY2A3L0_9ACTN|nr:hypothetical protein [Kribbella speibonae]TCC22979.1 hypothetical protein E0H58_21665 [Kribbella speibonae]